MALWRAARGLVERVGKAGQRYEKTTTGIVGLEVMDNGREELIRLSEKILNDIQSIPKEAAYRKNVEEMYNERLRVCKNASSVEEVEGALGEGQVEELIKAARGEEALIPLMKGVGHFLSPFLLACE